MAYLQTHFWAGGTEEQYEAMLKAVHPAGGLPEGQTSHVAGPTEGGYLISVVWDSKEHSEQFMNGTLLPALLSSSKRERSATPCGLGQWAPRRSGHLVKNPKRATHAELRELRALQHAC